MTVENAGARQVPVTGTASRGRAVMARYFHSEKGRAAQARYRRKRKQAAPARSRQGRPWASSRAAVLVRLVLAQGPAMRRTT
jgi:hypothetical protein